MDGSKTLHTCLIQTLQSTNPKLQIGVYRILHEYGHVNTLHGIGQSLHGKGISRRTSTDPQDVYIVLESQLDMLRGCHFSRHQHVCLVLHLFHPGQCLLAITLETARLGTWLPHTGTEVMTALHRQLAGSFHHLLLSLSTAGTCNDKGAFVVTRKIQFFQFQFHNYNIVFIRSKACCIFSSLAQSEMRM